MKVVLVTPYYHQPRGNTVTVERISLGLARLGVTTEIISVTQDSRFPQLSPTDLVHGFNADQFDLYWKCRGSSSNPYLVTLTGTDLNYSLFNKETRNRLIQTLEGSKAIHVFNKGAQNQLHREVLGLEKKVYVVPQGTSGFPPNQGKLKKEAGSFTFVLPAGIRKVKNVPAAISLLNPLYEQDSRIRLWIAGPVIEKEEWDKVSKLIGENSHWIQYLGEIPHNQMGEIYNCADVVLNTSLSEGQSSSVLESMAMGIPVLVSDIAANRDIVSRGITGFLYSGQQDFIHYAQRLMEDEGLRGKMGIRGQQYVKIYHSGEKEAKALLNIYHRIIGDKTLSNAAGKGTGTN